MLGPNKMVVGEKEGEGMFWNDLPEVKTLCEAARICREMLMGVISCRGNKAGGVLTACEPEPARMVCTPVCV